MHLKQIRAQNFRAFGDGKTAPLLDWTLSPGLNILIGENDAGKTAVVDAIRHILWTTSYEFVRLPVFLSGGYCFLICEPSISMG
jgi:putative ATP-dependent endonuclease of the OLD family